MKFYSEKLKKLFETEAEVIEAEKIFDNKLAEKENSKKALSQRIEEAEKNLDKAYQDYDAAKERAAKILDESNKQVMEILNEAKLKVAEAERARTDAIVNFNQNFGVYRANYSGERAIRESDRVHKLVEDLFNMPLFNKF